MNAYPQKTKFLFFSALAACVALCATTVFAGPGISLTASHFPTEVKAGQEVDVSFKIANFNSDENGFVTDLTCNIAVGSSFILAPNTIVTASPQEIGLSVSFADGLLKGSGGVLMEKGDSFDTVIVSATLLASDDAVAMDLIGIATGNDGSTAQPTFVESALSLPVKVVKQSLIQPVAAADAKLLSVAPVSFAKENMVKPVGPVIIPLVVEPVKQLSAVPASVLPLAREASKNKAAETVSPTIVFSDIVPSNSTYCDGNDGSIVVNFSGTAGHTFTATAKSNTSSGFAVTSERILNSTGTASIEINGLLAGNYTVSVRDITDRYSVDASELITVSGTEELDIVAISTTNRTSEAVNDGTITVSLSGGSGFYEAKAISSNPPFTSHVVKGTSPLTLTQLPSGQYDIEVRDSLNHTCSILFPTEAKVGASGDISIPRKTIVGASTLSINVVLPTMPPLCYEGNDGSIDVIITGGTEPYTVTATPNFTSAPHYQQVPTTNGGNAGEVIDLSNLQAGEYTIQVVDSQGHTTSTVAIVDQAIQLIMGSLVIAHESRAGLNDGSISIPHASGLYPLHYCIKGPNKEICQQSNTFEKLAPGEYVITVLDGNECASAPVVAVVNSAIPANQTGTVKPVVRPTGTSTSDPTKLAIQLIPTAVLSAGQATGKLFINVTGGKQPYKYSIDNGKTFGDSSEYGRLAAGTYSVVVKDALGSLVSGSAHVSQPDSAVFKSIKTTPVSSFGSSNGVIKLQATGGAGGFEYSIDGGITFTQNNVFTGLKAKKYVIAVRDHAGCITKGAAIVGTPARLNVSAIVNRASRTITVQATGGTAPLKYSVNGGATFKTSNGFTNLRPGKYTVVVEDAHGGRVSTSATI